MVDVVSKRCGNPGCNKYPSCGVEGGEAAEFCTYHKKEGIVEVKKKRVAKFCAVHQEEGMVNLVSKKCRHPGCNKHPTYGVACSKTTEFCVQLKKEGMVNVKGGKTAEFCAVHQKEGMVDVKKKRCSHLGCNKKPSYGVEGSNTAEVCAQHKKEGMVNPRSGSIFVGRRSSGAGDTSGQRAGDLPLGRVGEDKKRKGFSPRPAEGQTSFVRKHAKGEIGFAAVKVEENVSMSDLPGAVEAVGRTTGGQKTRHGAGAAQKHRRW
eukprot:g13333.t1